MTADNTSSEFALLTYAHHIVDTLANGAGRLIDYPSVVHFIRIRLEPLSITRLGAVNYATLTFISYTGWIHASSVLHSDRAFSSAVGSQRFFSSIPELRFNGFSLRCVARSKLQFVPPKLY